MPKMVMTHRRSPFSVISTTGHSYVFVPGKAIMVQPDDVELCQMRGAAFVDEATREITEGNIPKKDAPPSREEVFNRMRILFDKMIAAPMEYREHFTATGRPNLRWTASTVDADISSSDINKVWNEAVRDNERAMAESE